MYQHVYLFGECVIVLTILFSIATCEVAKGIQRVAFVFHDMIFLPMINRWFGLAWNLMQSREFPGAVSGQSNNPKHQIRHSWLDFGSLKETMQPIYLLPISNGIKQLFTFFVPLGFLDECVPESIGDH